MVSNAIDTCPMCDAIPSITGRWLYQVRCKCGACGPKRHTRHEAISRWSSVVGYVNKLRRGLFAAPQLQAYGGGSEAEGLWNQLPAKLPTGLDA